MSAPFHWCPGRPERIARSSFTIGMAFSCSGGIRRTQRDKRPDADELPRRSIRTEIPPAQNRCHEAQRPRVQTPEPGHHRQALILGQEALIRCKRLPPNLDPQRRADPDVADPVDVRTPGRADDCQPPYSKPPSRSSSGDPRLCITPSRVTNSITASFRIALPSSRPAQFRLLTSTRANPCQIDTGGTRPRATAHRVRRRSACGMVPGRRPPPTAGAPTPCVLAAGSRPGPACR